MIVVIIASGGFLSEHISEIPRSAILRGVPKRHFMHAAQHPSCLTQPHPFAPHLETSKCLAFLGLPMHSRIGDWIGQGSGLTGLPPPLLQVRTGEVHSSYIAMGHRII